MTTDDTNSERRRTAYLGPEASFSHQAAFEALPHTDPLPLLSFGAILKALQENWSSTEGFDYAVLPVENSTNGSVVQALDLLARCGLDPETSFFNDIEVVDEYYLEVHHCLFVLRMWAEKYLDTDELRYLEEKPTNWDPVPNGTKGNSISQSSPWPSKLEDIMAKLNIKTIYSHPQVWGQCNNILSTLLPPGHVDRVDMSSTSAAAAFVADSAKSLAADSPTISTHTAPNGSKEHSLMEDGGIAAISSSLAGQKHSKDLICIASNIEDDPGSNTTRFFILRNKKRKFDVLSTISRSPLHPTPIKSLLAFTTLHHMPGSLAHALAIFAQCGFNLTAIQSRPRPKPPKRTKDLLIAKNNQPTSQQRQPQDSNWKYVFFVECLHARGHEDVGGHDRKVETLLNELRTAMERLVLLGSWQDRLSM